MISNSFNNFSQKISRRSLLKVLSSLPLCLLACQRERSAVTANNEEIALGVASSFSEGVSVDRLKRLAIMRRGQDFYVLSMLCTHQACALNYEQDQFVCPCHGARFDLSGKVLQGPAIKNLSWTKARVNADGQIVW